MKAVALLLTLAALVFQLTTPDWAAAQPSSSDPESVVKALDAALNAHDLDAALALFADEAVVKDGDPAPGTTGNYVGKDQIRDWLNVIVDPALEFHVQSANHQAVGEIITWTWTATIVNFKQLGIDPEDGSSAALVQGGKIRFYSVASSAEWRAKLFAAITPPVSLPKTGDGPSSIASWLILMCVPVLLGLGLALRRGRRVD